jgi:hypothetical protein
MRLGVMLGGLAGVMVSVKPVTMRDMGVMAREVMLALFVVLGSVAMVLRRLLVVLGSCVMMVGFRQSAHSSSPQWWRLMPPCNCAGRRCRRGDNHMNLWRRFLRFFNAETIILHKKTAQKKIVSEIRPAMKDQTFSA